MANKAITQQSKPGSWADKMKVSDSNMQCFLEPLPKRPMGSILKIPHDMHMADEDIWKRSMIGFFVSYKLPFHAIQSIANRIWKSHGLEKTTVMSNRFMIFRFSIEEAIGEILARGPWLFGGKTIILQQWQPGFLFDKSKIKTIPVWARLQGLPFPLWNKEGLSLAVSMVGKPLASDEATMKCSRLEYARVCIEVDASFPLTNQFQVVSQLSEEPITVDVSYEWKPSRCAKCMVFGHSCKVQDGQEANKEKIEEVENCTEKPNEQDDPRAQEHQKDHVKDHEIITVTSEASDKERPKVMTVSSNQNSNDNGNEVVKATVGSEQSIQSEKNSKGKQQMVHVLCMENKMDSLSSGNMGNGIGKEYANSSSSGKPPDSPNGSSSSTPKPKKLQATILPSQWGALSNLQTSSNCRILIGWNERKFNVSLIHLAEQWMTCSVKNISSRDECRLTFVYGSNSYQDRKDLWQYLDLTSASHATMPWAIMGDFNASLRPSDRSGGSNVWYSYHNEFPECISKASLHQVPYTGVRLSWNNGQSAQNCGESFIPINNQAQYVEGPLSDSASQFNKPSFSPSP
ncbi:GLYCINE-RICH CELL WALL STRUCTURAL PROTEIN 1.8-LIKE [Salix viminalis]|uniref:GLYCINE-RICH CELL WALL STRUCTURAL PROTEIN 1.8-LIKE n=1 Tax=Salix viminalis TaxID=40686 RepID=A0A9Q0UK32_SALVM|nr:GLYCINE-RICH CELL WALL STRUCTURAL PROTEIN 1.8-LIKE [Salix viminalis]